MIKTRAKQLIQSGLPLVIIMTGAYLFYVQVFSGIWLMDDLKVLVDNPDIRSLSNFLEDYYPSRPLRELTYLFDYSLFGLDPAGYYIQNIFWHGLCSWLVFLLVKQLQAPVTVAWLTSLLFMLHPIQVEVVANTSHRKDSLALAFCLLAFISYLRGRKTGRTSEKKWFVFSALFWGVALTAKQNALVLPFVPIAYELFRMPVQYRFRVITVLVPMTTFGIIGRLVYLVNSQDFVQKVNPALRKLEPFVGGTAENYFQTVFKAWAFMGAKLFYPVDLSMEYTFSVPTHWLDPWVIFGLLGLIVTVFALFYFLQKHCLLFYFGFAWFMMFWLPTSSLLGHFSYFAADRYWYSPSVGIFLLISYGCYRLLQPHLKIFIVSGAVLLTLLGWQAWNQQRIWCDKEVFYRHMHRVNPEALEGFIGLGHLAMTTGDYDTAVTYFQKAFQRSPQDGRIAHNLGYIAYRQGQHKSAKNYFETAITLNPNLMDIYNNLGSLYDDLGQSERAIETLERGLAINSHFEKAYTNLGIVYERLGQMEKAEELHRRAIFERFDYGLAHLNLGNTLYNSNRKKEALNAFTLAIKYSPENVDALYNYAFVADELNRRDLLPSVLVKLRKIDPLLAEQLEKEIE